jgi:phosphatidylinositol alpha-1,6-mannosyltransferase
MTTHRLRIYTHEFFPKRGGIASYCHEFAKAASGLGYPTIVHAPCNAMLRNDDSPYRLEPGRSGQTHNWPSVWATRQLLTKTLTESPNDLHLLAEPGPIIALGMVACSKIKAAKIGAPLYGSEIFRWQRPGIQSHYAIRGLSRLAALRPISGPIAELAASTFPELVAQTKTVNLALPSDFVPLGETSRQLIDSSNYCRILSVGRIHRRKGFDQIVQAIAELPETIKSNLCYRIAGAQKDRRYLNELRQLAANNGVDLQVHLDPDDAALDACYRQADVFALTSRVQKTSIEGFGLVYLEAGAHRLPCVAYACGGVCDAVRDGDTGILVEPENLAALSQVLRKLYEDPKLRRQMGQNNHRFATSRHWQDVVRETLDGLV